MLTEIKTDRKHYFIDENNLIQGEYKDYYDNGNMCTHCFFLNDVPHGEYKEYAKNGVLLIHAFYQNGIYHGEYKGYYTTGQLYEHYFYQNDDLHGECKSYHNDGQLWEHAFYLNGLFHGEQKLYDNLGKLRMHAFYKNGKRHGEYHGKFDTFFFNDVNIRINPLLITPKQKLTIMLSERSIPIRPLQKLFTSVSIFSNIYATYKPRIIKLLRIIDLAVKHLPLGMGDVNSTILPGD